MKIFGYQILHNKPKIRGVKISAQKVFPVRFGKYLLLDRISTGGMAEVFLAKTFGVEGFQKTLAIKKILPHISEDEGFVTMFIDEAKIVSRLQHANICQVYEFGKLGDDFYQVMEYISGLSLKYLARTFWDRKENLPFGPILHIISKVCDGLDYAHSLKDRNGNPYNIVHRDVTPANILVSFEGSVKLIDFGIAKAAQRSTKTQAGIVKGKFGYMTPEQLEGKELDNRSDIFSLGIVLWELLAGKLLFNEKNELDNLKRILTGDYKSIAEVRHDIPSELERVVMKALAHDRDERYSTAEEFGTDLNRVAFNMGLLWNTSKLQNFLKQNFASELTKEQVKRTKFFHITEDDFMSYPSIILEGDDDDDDEEFDEEIEIEELDESDLFMEEIDDDEDVSTSLRFSDSRNKQNSVSTTAKRGVIETPSNYYDNEDSYSTEWYEEKTVGPPDRPRFEFSDSFEVEEDFEDQTTMNYGKRQTFPSNSFESDSDFDDSTAMNYSGSFEANSFENDDFDDATSMNYGNPPYSSQYEDSVADNFSDETTTGFGGNAYPDSYAENTYSSEENTYSSEYEDYYGQESYDNQNSNVYQGYYDENGQWQNYQGYYDENGQWQSYQGYYDENGQWQSYQGYYDENGQWQNYQGYYDENGQWHDYAEGYYQNNINNFNTDDLPNKKDK